MSNKIHISNAFIVNEGSINIGDIIIKDNIISKISLGKTLATPEKCEFIDAKGLYLIPGVIDDQVHFREPGLTEKADIYHESKAAIAGGVTSYMDMPNTNPPTTSIELLNQKFKIAEVNSFANYSFYIGANNNNLEEIIKTPIDFACGIKIFLGSSTGNLKLNDIQVLENIFSQTKHIVAVHCEDDNIIKNKIKKYISQYGDNIPIEFHHKIRNSDSCYSSSSMAVALAKKHKTKLHILHISTKNELELFDNNCSIEEKQITSEVCVHHLWFTATDYLKFGSKIKWNPSIKDIHHREALRKGIIDGTIDIIATDHAPHLLIEKLNPYTSCPSGAPIIQISLQMMLELVKQGVISLEKTVELMCHNPSLLFKIKKRGFIKENHFADLVLLDLNKPMTVSKENIFSKCKWSPLENYTFSSSIETTFVNGKKAFHNGKVNENYRGKKLEFERENL